MELKDISFTNTTTFGGVFLMWKRNDRRVRKCVSESQKKKKARKLKSIGKQL